jgi:hypothetical protein
VYAVMTSVRAVTSPATEVVYAVVASSRGVTSRVRRRGVC